ncbi:hypothetical protein CK203_082584 [Vitis vinifera]|uniref:DUF629 domain-containing protein n=1 Tax=Vitis vinifera TaxID=29760 RepID=A0A438CLA0_VITVI|nr:hypothetical protein CK203_082584 [Vitis vinifera]
MGLKNRGSGSGSGSKAAPKSVAEGAAAAAGLDKVIKPEIERAQSVFRRGNHKKALKLMQELCRSHQSSALAHNVRVEPARRARFLSPKSVEYAHFYAHLLFELADDKESYQEVMRECQRALKFLQEGDQLDQLMPQSRMAELHQELEALVKKSTINMYSTMMIKLGLGDLEEKFKFNSKEEKKKLRTSTEGRREIEAQMEVARVPQKTLESLPLEEGEEELSSRALRLERRKKSANIKKMVSLGDRIKQVKKYWNSLSSDTRRGLLQVRISDLRAYFSSSKDDLAAAVLSEAIAFAENNKTWKFMACCVCDEKFTDLSPYRLGSDYEKGIWKPVDALAVFQTSEDRVKSWSSSIVKRHTMIDMDDYLEICIKDHWESYSTEEKKKQFDEEFMEVEIGNQKDEGGNHEPRENDWPGWPLSDDPQRERTLNGIQAMFQMLLRQRHLATRHIVQVMQYTMDELQIFASVSQLLNHGLDHTLLCICFLGVSQLEKVLRFLQSVAYICGVTKCSEKGSSKDKVFVGAQGGELNLSTYNDAIADDGSAVTSAIDDHENDVLPDEGTFPLRRFVSEKSMHSIYEDALQAIERVCLEESKRRAQDPEYLPQYYEYLLEQLRREVKVDDGDMLLSYKCELDLISNILKEKSDTVVEETIRRYEVQVTLELCRIDARIMRVVAAMRQQDLKLGAASALDYRSIMVILLKSFVRARLEDLVDKDAIKKSDVAREALLAQLALDSEKNISRGGYNTKQMQRKSKDKKKNKSYRKAKDLKASSGNEQLLLHEEDAKQAYFPDAFDDQNPNSKIGIPVSAAEIKQPEEELRLQLELEAEERKLKEILEFQLQIENESKQKHLAEQNKVGGMIERQISGETAKRSSAEEAPKLSATIFIGTIPLVAPQFTEKLAEETLV